jgi:cell division protein FtsB
MYKVNALVYPFPLKISLPNFRKALWPMALASIIALFSFCFWQNARLVDNAYKVQRLEKQLSELKQENRVLEANNSQNNSLSTLEQLIQNLGLEKVQNVDFIEYPGGTVVSR